MNVRFCWRYEVLFFPLKDRPEKAVPGGAIKAESGLRGGGGGDAGNNQYILNTPTIGRR